MAGLQELSQLARLASVSFEISFEEASDLWFGRIHSAAEGEGFEIKNAPLGLVLSELRRRLLSLSG